MKSRLVIVVSVATLLAILAFSGVGLDAVSSSVNQPAIGYVTIRIQGDSRVYRNRDAIPLNWGTVSLGSNIRTVTITNNANINLRGHLAITTPRLPRGWSLTFSLENQIIRAGRSAVGTLTLNLPANPSPGNYNWHATIIFDRA